MHIKLTGVLSVFLLINVAAALDPAWFSGLTLLELLQSSQQTYPAPCDGYFITNAKITTQDPARPSATRLRTLGSKIAWVGDSLLDYLLKVGDQVRPCKIINAQGRRVGPGIFDSHIHLLRAATEAGCQIYDAELARNQNQFLNAVQEGLSDCNPGEIIAVTGGFNLASIGGSFPTLAQLDALVPSHRFIMAQRYTYVGATALTFAGPGATNSLMRDYLNDNGFFVAPDGQIPTEDLNAIIAFLRTSMTHDEKVLSHKRLFDYLHRKGVIGGHDMNGFAFVAPNDYEIVRELYRNGELDMAIAQGIQAFATPGGIEGFANWETSRIGNRQGTDDSYWIAGMSETFFNPAYLGNEAGLTESLQTVRNSNQKDEWALCINSEYIQNGPPTFAALQNVYASHGIPEYTWAIEHGYGFNETMLQWLDEKRIFYSVEATRYLWGSNAEGLHGPPLRTFLQQSTDPLLALNTDGRNASPINWWISAQFWVDGKNVTGHVINADETISIQNVYKYGTYGTTRKVRQLPFRGTITAGKLADFVIWKQDFLTVATSKIRETEAKTTFFRGRIVFQQ